ncbi:hypothetical protein ACU686_38690 [Yinghuangia aomiensis]
MARERVASAAPGAVPLSEFVAHMCRADQVTVVEEDGRTLYHGVPRRDRTAGLRKER